MGWKLFAAGAAVTLAACATSFSSLQQELPRLVGQDLSVAIGMLGAPDGKVDLPGAAVYVWDTAATFTAPAVSSSTTAGTVGTIPFQAHTTSHRIESSDLRCRLKLTTSAQHRVTEWTVDGDNGACFKFSDRLKPLL